MKLTRLLVAAFIWLVLCASLWATDSRPAVVALAAVVAVSTTLVVLTADMARNIGDTGWPPPRQSVQQDDGDPWITQLRYQMAGAGQTGSTELHERLVSLVDDRLRIHHHIDRLEQPAAANRVLSPTLRDLLTGPPRRLSSGRTLQRTITEIEAL